MRSLFASLFLLFAQCLTAQVSYNFTQLPTKGGFAFFGLASADFNRDGKPDLATTDDGGVDVYLATSAGHFAPAVRYALPFDGDMLVASDINNDGFPDLALASAVSGSTVMLLLNNKNGTFRNGTPIHLAHQGDGRIAAGDFNGDGNIDVVVQQETGAGQFQSSPSQFVVYLGHGNGTFTAGQKLVMSSFSSSPLVEDLNGDGKLDIANVIGTKALIWPGIGEWDLRQADQHPCCRKL